MALVIAFVAAVTSGETPLNVIQLLWVNLIMDALGALGKSAPCSSKEGALCPDCWLSICFWHRGPVCTVVALLAARHAHESKAAPAPRAAALLLWMGRLHLLAAPCSTDLFDESMLSG